MTTIDSGQTEGASEFKTLLQRAQELDQEARDVETEKHRVSAIQNQLALDHLNSFVAYVNTSSQFGHPSFDIDGARITISTNDSRLTVDVVGIDNYQIDSGNLYDTLETFTQDQMLETVLNFIKNS